MCAETDVSGTPTLELADLVETTQQRRRTRGGGAGRCARDTWKAQVRPTDTPLALPAEERHRSKGVGDGVQTGTRVGQESQRGASCHALQPIPGRRDPRCP